MESGNCVSDDLRHAIVRYRGFVNQGLIRAASLHGIKKRVVYCPRTEKAAIDEWRNGNGHKEVQRLVIRVISLADNKHGTSTKVIGHGDPSANSLTAQRTSMASAG